MKVHEQPLSDVVRYLDSKRGLTLDHMKPEYEGYLRVLRRFIPLTAETRILEIGTGTGWFPLLCSRDGYQCKGIEISPQLIDFARQLGHAHGLEPNIELGNIEEADIGDGIYDAIFANSVFEHIEHWQLALERACRALKPGGMFFFASTSKFSLISDEYKFPLYGWLPDAWRYRLRIARQGPDIMHLGIDFNQFTYPGLRKALRRAGFSRVIDRIDLAEKDRFPPHVRFLIEAARAFPPLRHLLLTFSRATLFVCIK